MSRELVVIGASWGGVRALGTVLGALPRTFRPAIAVAQHRGADAPSGGLADVLACRTALPVHEAVDKEPIVPGHVHVAPADYHLLVERGTLALSADAPERYSRPSINVLFESAADAYGPEVIGVILTGASDDGAAGLARIRQRGGVGVVQDPETAERRQMPEAALAAGGAHRVLSLDQIAPFLDSVCGSVLNNGRR